MILYHGSYINIPIPDLTHSRTNVDFGTGFYTTPIYEQAEKWAYKFKKQNKTSVINQYNFDEKTFNCLKVLKFETYSEQWLDFILDCRRGNDKTDYDIVLGGVANDKVFNTVELYFDNLIDKTEAIKRLKYENPNLQLCFRTAKALSYLHYERSIVL